MGIDIAVNTLQLLGYYTAYNTLYNVQYITMKEQAI